MGSFNTTCANFINEIRKNNIEFINLDEENLLTEFLFDYNLIKISKGILYLNK